MASGRPSTRAASHPTSRLIIADPATSQVAFYGAAKENGHGVLFGVRLKHKAQRITEIEQFVIRRGPAQIGEFDNPMAFEAAWTEALPVGRAPAACGAGANSQPVFRGHREVQRRHHSPGVRRPAAWRTAFARRRARRAADGKPPQSIRETFNSGMFQYIREIKPRRFLLVDEERGVVYTMVMFQHPGNVTGLTMWDKQYKDPTSIIVYPNSMAMTESFRIRGGKITHIVAQMVMLPYRQPTGW